MVRRINFHTKLSRLFAHRPAEPEDSARRAFIVRVLLLALITLLAIAMVSSVLTSLSASVESRENNALSLVIIGIVLFGFVGLYALLRIGYVRTVSLVLVSSLLLFSLYLAFRWGVDLPAAMLLYALCIVISGIVVGSRFSLAVTAVLASAIYVIQQVQESGYVLANNYWRTEQLTGYDTIVIGVMLAVVATVSWLSTREIEKSLLRARESEAMLKLERDLLEDRVRERTQELRQAELERMSQAYRFVEFGRLASGIFHDLANPLTALALTIEGIERGAGSSPQVATMAGDIARARSATMHMQSLMDAMRRHLAREGVVEQFSLGEVLAEARVVLDTYARQRSVRLTCVCEEDLSLLGDPVSCMQVLTNLVTNAIESYEGEKGEVTVSCTKGGDGVYLRVSDRGVGITPDELTHIFEPFFSTKTAHTGLGVGLPLARRIVEKDFGGRITVASSLEDGTTFTVYFPQREP